MPDKPSVVSVFQKYEAKAYPYFYQVKMQVATIAGGVPSDEHVAEAWIKSKLAGSDDLIREAVAMTMAERGITADEAAVLVDKLKHLNGFKRGEQDSDHPGELYIEGRQLKAMLKEAVSVAANEGKIVTKGWGSATIDNKNYLKGIKGWLPEHVFVTDNRAYLGVKVPDGIMQRFVHAPHGTGIQYEEYVSDCEIVFHIETDHAFTEEQWAMIFLTGQRQGVGASRSQGFGQYKVTGFDQVNRKTGRVITPKGTDEIQDAVSEH